MKRLGYGIGNRISAAENTKLAGVRRVIRRTQRHQ